MTAHAIWLYAGAMIAIWLTPGPVWVAIMARALSGGFAALWPLTLGVAIGDTIWPLIAIFGLSVFVQDNAALLEILRWVAAIVFIAMGLLLLRHDAGAPQTDRRLTRKGRWAGFSAGLLAITGNPKAALFYVGVLPGFIDPRRATATDIAIIVVMSATIPLALNLAMGGAVATARARLASPSGMALMSRISSGLLIAVGLTIAVTTLSA